MAITLDGTNGILSPDFEPSSSTTPTNGLFLPTTNSLGFATNSAERLRLDASGNLGIGTSSPLAKTNVVSTGAALGGTAQLAIGSGTNNYENTYLRIDNSGNSNFCIDQIFGGTSLNRLFIERTTGNVGIGTSSPGQRLDVLGGSNAIIRITSSGDLTTGSAAYVRMAGSNSATAGYIGFGGSASTFDVWNDLNGPINFGTNGLLRARIDSSGNLLVGTTSNNGTITSFNSSATGRAGFFMINAASSLAYDAVGISKYDNNTTTSQVFVKFFINNNGSASGFITANGANAATFTSSSDARLKENITALPDQLANICALKPSEFDYKDGTGHQIGFIAQEMEEVYPDCVAEDGDGMLMISGWSKTEARLVKAIQELTARLEALEAK